MSAPRAITTRSLPKGRIRYAKDKTTIAAESEIVALSDKTFLMLAVDPVSSLKV